MKKVICSVVLAFQVGLSLQASDGVVKNFFKDRRFVVAAGALAVGAIGGLAYIAWSGYKFNQGLKKRCNHLEEAPAKSVPQRPALTPIVARQDTPGSVVVETRGVPSPIAERQSGVATSPAAEYERGLSHKDVVSVDSGSVRSPRLRARTGSFESTGEQSWSDKHSPITVVGAAGPIINPTYAASGQ